MHPNTNKAANTQPANKQKGQAFDARLRQMELGQVKALSIIELLEFLGHTPVRIIYGKAWYHAPWRYDRTESLCVYTNKRPQDWFDYGDHRGGSIIDLVMHYFPMSYTEAVRYLRKYAHDSRP